MDTHEDQTRRDLSRRGLLDNLVFLGVVLATLGLFDFFAVGAKRTRAIVAIVLGLVASFIRHHRRDVQIFRDNDRVSSGDNSEDRGD